MSTSLAMQIEAPVIQSLTPNATVPEEIQEQASQWLESYNHSLNQYIETVAHQPKLNGARPQAGTTTQFGYKYWDVVLVGPRQFYRGAPTRPGKIIAAGEWSLMLGIVFVNPVDDPGGGISGQIALGARDYRVKMETLNLSSVTDGPEAVGVATFPNSPPTFTYWHYWFQAPDPGADPQLYETYFTADVSIGAQPFAAFSTWHYDPDTEPGFLMPQLNVPNSPVGSFPSTVAGWRYETPARYLVYRR